MKNLKTKRNELVHLPLLLHLLQPVRTKTKKEVPPPPPPAEPVKTKIGESIPPAPPVPPKEKKELSLNYGTAEKNPRPQPELTLAPKTKEIRIESLEKSQMIDSPIKQVF